MDLVKSDIKSLQKNVEEQIEAIQHLTQDQPPFVGYVGQLAMFWAAGSLIYIACRPFTWSAPYSDINLSRSYRGSVHALIL